MSHSSPQTLLQVGQISPGEVDDAEVVDVTADGEKLRIERPSPFEPRFARVPG